MNTYTLLEAVKRLVKERDDFVADVEGHDPFTSIGCIDCTVGTVPDSLNTGRCPYHYAKEALRHNAAGIE